MYIYCVQINQALDETPFQEMIRYISPEKKVKIQRFRKPIDAMRSLLGDLIIRYILCKHYGFDNDEIQYGYLEFGKPYLKQHTDIHFNISHSGDWIVGVVSNDLVGIDIEKVTHMKENLSSIVLTDNENKKLQALNESERNLSFFELWTLKESYVKSTGSGLSEGLHTLEISMNNGIIRMKKNEQPIHAYFEILDSIEGYKFSLCSLSQSIDRKIKLFSYHEFKEEIIGFLETSSIRSSKF